MGFGVEVFPSVVDSFLVLHFRTYPGKGIELLRGNRKEAERLHERAKLDRRLKMWPVQLAPPPARSPQPSAAQHHLYAQPNLSPGAQQRAANLVLLSPNQALFLEPRELSPARRPAQRWAGSSLLKRQNKRRYGAAMDGEPSASKERITKAPRTTLKEVPPAEDDDEDDDFCFVPWFPKRAMSTTRRKKTVGSRACCLAGCFLPAFLCAC